MNNVILLGRLTRDCNIRISADGQSKIARYTLVVDRRFAKRDDPNAQTADFISCVAFGKNADFADNYLRQGTKILVRGAIRSGSYTKEDGQKVYTTDVVVEEHEFAESKKDASQGGNAPAPQTATVSPDGFVGVPSDDDDLEIDVPFV